MAGNPAVQKATGSVGAKATELSKTAKDKAADKLPGFAANAVSKLGGNPDKVPGLSGQVNGSNGYPNDPAVNPYNPPPGTAS